MDNDTHDLKVVWGFCNGLDACCEPRDWQGDDVLRAECPWRYSDAGEVRGRCNEFSNMPNLRAWGAKPSMIRESACGQSIQKATAKESSPRIASKAAYSNIPPRLSRNHSSVKAGKSDVPNPDDPKAFFDRVR